MDPGSRCIKGDESYSDDREGRQSGRGVSGVGS